MKNRFLILLATFSILLNGCESIFDEKYTPYYVVESYQFGNEPLQKVKLSTTAEMGQQYRFEDLAVSAATVRVHLLSATNSNTVDSTFVYELETPGIFVQKSDDRQHIVLPKRTYKLEITDLNTPGISSARIEATTVIPDAISIDRLGFESDAVRPPFVSGNEYSAVYQQFNQLVLDLRFGEFTEGRNQQFFIFSIAAEDTNRANLTPIYATFLQDEADMSQVARNESGIVNQANYQSNPDGTVSIPFPWIAIAFYGRNEIIINSLDKNYYDFRRSQQVQLGNGSTVSPGEINNPIYNIKGALGLFGSMSRTSFMLNVQRIGTN